MKAEKYRESAYNGRKAWIRYADDIAVLAKSPRAAQRLLETTQRYLEGKLKLKMNVDKGKVVSVYSIRNFKFLGFALGRGENGVYIRAHAKTLKKAKAKLKELTSRSQGRNVRQVMENVKVYIRGWLGNFWIANMKSTMQRWDEWLMLRHEGLRKDEKSVCVGAPEARCPGSQAQERAAGSARQEGQRLRVATANKERSRSKSVSIPSPQKMVAALRSQSNSISHHPSKSGLVK